MTKYDMEGGRQSSILRPGTTVPVASKNTKLSSVFERYVLFATESFTVIIIGSSLHTYLQRKLPRTTWGAFYPFEGQRYDGTAALMKNDRITVLQEPTVMRPGSKHPTPTAGSRQGILSAVA
jgi:hypothetical protein